MKDLFRWVSGSRRPMLIAVLPLGIAALTLTGMFWPVPTHALTSRVADRHTPTAVPTQIAPTLIPSDGVTATLAPTPVDTPIPFVYAISEVPEAESADGTKRLFIVDAGLAMPSIGIHSAELRLPIADLRPQTGRYYEPRGIKYPTIHLGSDYILEGDDLAISPHENAILVAVAYLKRGTYQAVAIDMAGDTQMYWINITTGNFTGQFLLCFTHLADGSNAEALRQAQANNGRVDTMGGISTVGDDSGSLSDLHISVIDLDVLYDFSDTQDVGSAIRLLFSGTLPRVGQQHPHLFVEPESVWPALANQLEKYIEQP